MATVRSALLCLVVRTMVILGIVNLPLTEKSQLELPTYVWLTDLPKNIRYSGSVVEI